MDFTFGVLKLTFWRHTLAVFRFCRKTISVQKEIDILKVSVLPENPGNSELIIS